MDEYELGWTVLQSRIFSLLCKRAGEKLSQREIAGALDVSPTAVAKSLTGLEKNGLVKIEKTRRTNLVSFKRDEPRAIELKRAENLKSVYLSGLSDHLMNELAGGTIILFGSYAAGEDSNNSDIDIAVIERKDKVLRLEGFERILNRPINVNFYRSWNEIHAHLRNNILNGIVLHGSVEL